MPGKRITDHQVHKYKERRKRLSQTAAAAKTGISERSARRIERIEALPSQRPERQWRTRQDPLAGVWDDEVVPLLQADSALNSVTLLEELQRRYPGEYGPDVLRTLQRRVRQWRALHGAEREVYFAQEHPPGVCVRRTHMAVAAVIDHSGAHAIGCVSSERGSAATAAQRVRSQCRVRCSASSSRAALHRDRAGAPWACAAARR